MGVSGDKPNQSLRAARVRRGWTEDDVAAALHRLAAELGELPPPVDANRVSKWERGVYAPGRFYRPRLCLAFEVTPDEIGLPQTPRLMEDIGELGRRRADRAAQGEPGGAGADGSESAGIDSERLTAALKHLWPVDRALAADLARMGKRLSYRADTEPAQVVLPDLKAFVGAVTTLLSRSQPPELAVRLRRLGSTAAQHAGFLSDVDDRWGDAYANFAVSEALARESGSGTQLAQTLVNRAEVMRRRTRGPEELGPATELARAAEVAVGDDAPAGLHAWIAGELAAHEAETGDGIGSGRHLEGAERIEAGAAPGEMNLWAPDLDSAWLPYYRGHRALRLGLGDEAVEVYERVLATTDPRLLWERARALSQLASACLLNGEVDRACGLLAQAVELTVTSGDHRGLALARRMSARELSRWRSDPRVRDLDETLRAATRRLNDA